MQETARNQFSAEFRKQWFYFIAETNSEINDIFGFGESLKSCLSVQSSR